MQPVYPDHEQSFRVVEGRATSYFKILGRPDLTDEASAEVFMEELQAAFPRAHLNLQFIFVRDPALIESAERWHQFESAHPLSKALQARLDQVNDRVKSTFEACYLAVGTPAEDDIHKNVVGRVCEIFGALVMCPCTWQEFDDELSRPGTEVDPMPGKSDRAMNFYKLVEVIGGHVPWRMRFTIDINHPAAVKIVRKERRIDWLCRLVGARARMAPAYQSLMDENYSSWVVCDLKFDTWGANIAELHANYAHLEGVLFAGSFRRLLDYPVLQLEEAITLLPIYRPGSPWLSGDVQFRTRDGKAFPYRQTSNMRYVHTDLIFSKDESDTDEFRLATDAGLIASAQNLPQLARIQVGHAKDPLLSLLSKEVPASEQYLIGEFSAVAGPSFGVNIFDTALGEREPVDCGDEAIAMLEALFYRRLNKRFHGQMNAMALFLIRAAYNYFSDEEHPKLYVAGVDQAVDSELSSSGLTAPATWWGVTDLLHANQSSQVAELAQRHAVPVMADLVMMLRGNMEVRSAFGEAVGFGPEGVGADAFADKIEEVIKVWPSLSAPTTFDIGRSRFTTISVLPLQDEVFDVVENLTAALYLLARKAVCGEYFSDPNRYRRGYQSGASSYDLYHMQKRDSGFANGVNKKITYSNLEKVMGCESVNYQILTDMREARKLAVLVSMESSESYNNELYRCAGAIITLSPEKISKEDRSRLAMEQIGAFTPWHSSVEGLMNVTITTGLKSHRQFLRQSLVLPTHSSLLGERLR